MGLLAVVAAAGPKGITREQVLGILWPEAPEEQARHSLSQGLYTLRREAGVEWVTTGPVLRLAPTVTSDVGEFLAAVAGGELSRAAELHVGQFLEGFYLPGAPGFERWSEEERARFNGMALGAIERLAAEATAAGDSGTAIAWWRRLCGLDPASARYAVGLMRALAGAGDHAGALAHARTHAGYLQRELEAEADPAVERVVAELRAAPPPAPARAPVSPVRPAAPAPAETAPEVADRRAPPAGRGRRQWVVAAALLVAAVAFATSLRPQWRGDDPPTLLAVGGIRADDSVALGPVLRDMLATGLGSIDGLQVVANSRLVELIPRGADTSPNATTRAARQAGAAEVLEGEVGVDDAGLVFTLRRVRVETGVVRQGYTVHAVNRFALVDSAVAAVARDFGLASGSQIRVGHRTASPVAYALYEEGLRAFYKYDGPAAVRLMNAALERDSGFAMAAFYAWKAGRGVVPESVSFRAFQRAKRLAPLANEHERLLVQATVAMEDAPVAVAAAIAETLAIRYPSDPDGQILLGDLRSTRGDFVAAIEAYERAVVLDSVAGATSGAYCRVCLAVGGIVRTMLWADSAAAAERAARREIRFRPSEHVGWADLVEPLLRQGRREEAEDAMEQALRFARGDERGVFWLHRDLLRSGRFEEAERVLVAELRSRNASARNDARWLLIISLRYQGRLREAAALAKAGIVPGVPWRVPGAIPEIRNLAIIELERGNPAAAAQAFGDFARNPSPPWITEPVKARFRTWELTLAGTAYMAAGDTAMVRRLADTAEAAGQRSNYGRDPRLHHFLRGLLLQGEGRHAEAVAAFNRAMLSPTDGYSRINLELGRSLMALGRPLEAVAALQPPLRGGIDGSNTYLTLTEIHEALAQAFDQAGMADSATAHWRAVASAWRSADPPFQARLARAKLRAGAIPLAVDGH
jgi:DNA-binding SARP family transcriptional activator/tetratricopeptide (TPR) repeat protein